MVDLQFAASTAEVFRMNSKQFNRVSCNSLPVPRPALAIAVAIGLGLSGQVLAQATTGTIFGQAPAVSGETVQIHGGSGFNRTVPVDKTGRYSVELPLGTYVVTLMRDGQTIQSHDGISPPVGSAVTVNFEAAAAATNATAQASAKNMSAVQVTANALPAIDVSSTRESTVITAEQLKHLPLGRSGEAIALLAPGTVAGAAALGTGPTGAPLVSFGGASIAENAYYIDGFNTSDPLTNTGGITLPYGAIAQQQTITSGYGAEYGRSAGGVISQVGQSGTNTFHAGGQVLWQPAFAQGTPGNWYFENPLSQTPGQQKGDIQTYRNGNGGWQTVYDAYVSGPLIKDKLFFFLSVEQDKTRNNVVSAISSNANDSHYQVSDPKVYAKLDWNISANNILALTGIKVSSQSGIAIDNYDYSNHQDGAFSNYGQYTKNSFAIGIAKFTSYITDNLTLDVLYGKMHGSYYTDQPASSGLDPSLPYINNGAQENPAYTGGAAGGITNSNIFDSINSPDHKSSNSNLRLDLTWKLGDHTVQFGIDNQTTMDIDDGSINTGPGYTWSYRLSNNATQPTVGSVPTDNPYVAPTANYPNGAQGYYVSKSISSNQSTVQVSQRAQYVQDNWQVTPNLLLNLGLRNDQFTNYNPDHIAYTRVTSPQWAPRLGFSWDVFGDSKMKIFGNVGRYYLAMPSGVAVRQGGGSLVTAQYYTYGGIDANGVPLDLTPIATNPSGPVSLTNEYGQAIDPKVVSSTNLKAEYQDEAVLGFQQQITPAYVYGVTAMYRKLGRLIDDVGDPTTECAQLLAQNPNVPGVDCANVQSSVLINPGSTNTFRVANDNGGYNTFTVSPAQFGFPKASRNYYSLETYLEHPWDGTWTGKIDYVFSKSYGSDEGPVQSNIGSGGDNYSITTQWDYAQLMQYANGDQANDRKHVLKAYGTYQILPEWTVSGVLTLASGTPESCLGYYGPDQTNPGQGYGSSTHWCGGMPTPSGSTGFTPWLHTLDLSVEYRPDWAQKRLGFQLQVRNVFNEQKLTQIDATYGSTAAVAGQPANSLVNPLYLAPIGMEAPRVVQFGITYDL
jgi:outer membrane receptor protein involved in Fe transport